MKLYCYCLTIVEASLCFQISLTVELVLESMYSHFYLNSSQIQGSTVTGSRSVFVLLLPESYTFSIKFSAI